MDSYKANLPNLRRLFVEARDTEEESMYSRNAVGNSTSNLFPLLMRSQFYNIVMFMGSVAVFSLIAQRMGKISN